MYQLLILIPQEIDEELFHQLWPEFLHHAERMPGLISEGVDRVDSVLYGTRTFSRMYSFTFPDKQTLQEALSSEVGETAGNLIHQCTGGQATLLITDHRQETADQLRRFQQSEKNHADE